MGDDIGADGAPVSKSGTARDFGNMLNAYIPKKKKAVHGDKATFSPWTKMGQKSTKIGGF
jgi:hypothetical protein